MNFEQQSGDRRSWKGVQLDYDVIMSMSNRKCSYCLTEQQVTAILGVVDTFGWPTRWFSNSTDIDRQTVADFAAELERNLMGGCCDDNMPIQYRYTTGGELEWSLNGGQNWTAAPQYDPRVYSATFPPVPGDDGADKKCLAATGMVALIREQVGDQLTDDMSRYTLGQLITDWVKTMLQTSNPFEALLTVVTNQIFALSIALLRPALTTTVYNQLVCIFDCAMADDASFNTAQWQDVRSQITTQIAGIAGLFFEHLVYLLGEKGLTNLARAGGAAEGNCSDCDCDCVDGTCASSWTVFFGTEVNHTGCNIEASSLPETGHNTVSLNWDSVTGCYFKHAAITGGALNDQNWEWYLVDGSGPFFSAFGWPTNVEVQFLNVTSSTPFQISVDFADHAT